MKKSIVCACVAALAGVLAGADVLDLNGSWDFRFEEGKSIEESSGVAFAATDVMPVPGCYDTMPKWFLRRGTGLYRRTFTLDRAVENAWLVVDGMGLRGQFRVDGRDLGTHPYPYARLELETGPLAAGVHTLYAALDNRFDWSTMKLALPYYDFYFYGGFYHGVKLAFDNRKLFVRTRDYKTGTVEVEAVNFKSGDFEATLVFDEKQNVPVTFTSGRATVRVPGFKLWSPAAPNLHTVSVKTADSEKVVRARFGIRTVEAKNRKIYLNGEEIFLKGANRHESHIEFGAATSEIQMARDIQLMKDLGGNFFRGAHYQQAPRFLDLCDENGILVWEESLGWGNGQSYTDKKNVELTDPGFIAAQLHETKEMVRASFNHPCVIIFAFMNECGSTKKSCKALADQLIQTIKEQDSGRLVTFACNTWKGDLCHENTDIVAFNTYPGTIPMMPGLPEDLAEKVREMPGGGVNVITRYFREKYPDKPIFVSESGVGALYGYHDPMACVASEEFQNEYITDLLETIWTNPDLVGYAIWQFADNRTYHRNSRHQSGKLFGISIAGLFNHQRQPKKVVETVKKYFRLKGK